MSDLSYPDHCRITRVAGIDEWGNPIVGNEVYNGVCDYQMGAQTRTPIVRHSATVYLPAAVMTEVNDRIEVTTRLGRKYNGIVSGVDDLGLDLTGDSVTEIEIKQSTEK